MDTAFFILAKLGWAAIRPATLLMLLLAFGLVALWGGRLHAARGLIGTTLAAFVIVAVLPVGAPVLRMLETQHPRPDAPGRVAGIVVLGGAEEPLRAAHWSTPLVNGAADRYLEALRLARAHPDAWVMFTGGGARIDPAGGTEAAMAARLLIGAGVAERRLILEDRSRNTAENAALGRRLLPPEAAEDGAILLVTSAFHMPRAMASFCTAGWPPLTPWPTDYRTGGDGAGWDLAGHLRDLDAALREVVGLVAYRLTGRAVACDAAG